MYPVVVHGMDWAVSSMSDALEESGRQNFFLKHKLPYKLLLLQGVYVVVAVIIIIKIVLAISFVGMLTTLVQMFAGIKYLLKVKQEPKQVEHVPTYVFADHDHDHDHDHEHHDHHEHVEYSSYPGPPHGFYSRGDLEGARNLKSDVNVDQSISQENRRVRRRAQHAKAMERRKRSVSKKTVIEEARDVQDRTYPDYGTPVQTTQTVRLKPLKLPYKFLLLHGAHTVVAVLVVIKIVLALTFVWMVSALTKMFAGIRYLFKFKEEAKHVEHVPTYVFPESYHHDHHDHHEHEEYSSYPGPPHEPYKRVDLAGARSLEKKSKNYQTATGGIEKNSGIVGQDEILIRSKRSANTEHDICKRKFVCELHARAKEDPMKAFQLYFIKKDGLAKYWDHNEERSFDDCARAFPCHNTKGGKTKTTDNKDASTNPTNTETISLYNTEHKDNIGHNQNLQEENITGNKNSAKNASVNQQRAFSDYDSPAPSELENGFGNYGSEGSDVYNYSTEYETEYTS